MLSDWRHFGRRRKEKGHTILVKRWTAPYTLLQSNKHIGHRCSLDANVLQTRLDAAGLSLNAWAADHCATQYSSLSLSDSTNASPSCGGCVSSCGGCVSSCGGCVSSCVPGW